MGLAKTGILWPEEAAFEGLIMVDFRKHVSKKRDIDFTNLVSLFDSIDRQTSHIELRTVQQEALRILSERRLERDLILKISTGAGKTTVGLLYLWSFMEEKRQPVVYLCPTKQLCEQVSAESEKLGLNSVIYPANQSHPDVDGIRGKAIIICTYDKLFNAKTTFDRSDVMLRPYAIVLDDAHAGVEEIRDCFTLRISNASVRGQLIKILDAPCADYRQAAWNDIRNEVPNQLLEIPYWIWKPLLPQIEQIIGSQANDDKLKFVIPHILDILRRCRCVVSGAAIEIIPDILPVHKNSAYDTAEHRLFMSATLADDSVLVRELGTDISAAEKPVMPANDRGMGERMVVAPSLVDSKLDRAWVMSLCGRLSKKLNVVVLSPSAPKAREWESFGAQICLGDDVKEAVESLKDTSGTSRLVVFVQRYDGIDLPDKSCRVLVIDGMPLGEGILDRLDSSTSEFAGGTRNRLIYRIEQGMGRAVRSHADYAVILLAGNELAHFIAKHDVLSAMNPDTRAQLELAIDLSKMAKEDAGADPEAAVIDMINKCLTRDAGWKQFYNETVRKSSITASGTTDPNRLMLANAEREAFEFAISNNLHGAVKLLQDAIGKYVSDDSATKGWYLQRVANYQYDIDPGQALEAQGAAHGYNKSMYCPPGGIIKRPSKVEESSVQAVIYEWYRQFKNPNGAIAKIQDLKAQLSFEISHSIIEQALCDLAPLLGAKGSRPEQEDGVGPDDLWLWPDLSLIIEAKTESQKSLHKKDAGQLSSSINWFKENFPARKNLVPIIVANTTLCDSDAYFPDNTRVITSARIHELLEKIEQFYSKMIAEPLLYSTPQLILKLQQVFLLLPEQFCGNFTEKPQKSK
ncbi:MAG: DEAD/DEAH box helicase [Sedimentisphaerales bacterium]